MNDDNPKSKKQRRRAHAIFFLILHCGTVAYVFIVEFIYQVHLLIELPSQNNKPPFPLELEALTMLLSAPQ